jgi:hypothetical protein
MKMRNNCKTKMVWGIVLLSVYLATACTDNGVTTVYTVAFPGEDLLIEMADYKANDPDFTSVLEKSLAVKAQFADRLLVDIFYHTWENEFPDKPMASVFCNYRNRYEIHPTATNDVVWKYIHNEYFRYKGLATWCITARLERYGCRLVPDQYGLPDEPDSARSYEVVHYRLKNAEDTAAIKHLMTAVGEVGIWETYRIEEIKFPPIDDSQLMLCNPPDFPWDTPLLCRVKNEKECETMLTILNTYQDRFPQDLRFASGWPDAALDSLIPIYMLKSYYDGQSAMDGSEIIDAKTVSRKTDGRKYYALAITLNAVGAQLFARITDDNIGRELAVTIDGKVYCAPRVMSKVEAGKLEITGHFSKKELTLWENIITLGKLPIRCTVTN